MSDITTTPAETKRPATFQEFTVEFGDDSNRVISVGHLKMRLRGRFSRSNQYAKENGGRPMGQHMQRMPDIPGLRLTMRPGKRPGFADVVIFDPLEDDPDLMERINKVMKDAKIFGADGTFVKRSELVMNPDQTKSLLMELRNLEAARCLTVFKGSLPSEETISRLPGKELYDPWSNNPRKPKYVSDVEEWEQRLEQG